jgi:hypothetical protein
MKTNRRTRFVALIGSIARSQGFEPPTEETIFTSPSPRMNGWLALGRASWEAITGEELDLEDLREDETFPRAPKTCRISVFREGDTIHAQVGVGVQFFRLRSVEVDDPEAVTGCNFMARMFAKAMHAAGCPNVELLLADEKEGPPVVPLGWNPGNAAGLRERMNAVTSQDAIKVWDNPEARIEIGKPAAQPFNEMTVLLGWSPDEAAKQRLLSVVNRLHGYRSGYVPLDAKPSEEHLAAQRFIMAGHVDDMVSVEARIRLRADGNFDVLSINGSPPPLVDAARATVKRFADRGNEHAKPEPSELVRRAGGPR